MIRASINSIETLGAVDGPGIRVVVFFNSCSLRCKYCHNPEMWTMQEKNYTPEELVKKIVRYKPYFKRNNGGVTFSGGEPLMHVEFLIKTCQLLKAEGIHIALDTAGVGTSNYEELLKYVDLVIYDIKDITKKRYYELTRGDIEITWKFLKVVKKMHKKLIIRQVVVPGLHDNEKYLMALNEYLKIYFIKDDIQKIEFLPYHKLGSEKYEALNIQNPYKDLEEMNPQKTEALYQQFLHLFAIK